VEAVVERPKTRRKSGPTKPDWPAIKMLFVTGKTHAELADATGIKIGTIFSRSSREEWDKDRKRVQEIASQSAEKAQVLLASMPERALNWRERVVAVADKSMRVLETEQPATLKEVTGLTAALDHVDKVARRSYGLDDEAGKGNTIVNLGFLQSFPDDPLRAAVIESP
jgi:hypothetical protein